MSTFTEGGPRVYSMIFSLLTVSLSYIHSGIRLFDPTAEFTRKYLRAIPGSFAKKFLRFLERKATRQSIGAAMWMVPYLIVFAGFTTLRAIYDVAESMLAEIIWLSFAIVSIITLVHERLLTNAMYAGMGLSQSLEHTRSSMDH